MNDKLFGIKLYAKPTNLGHTRTLILLCTANNIIEAIDITHKDIRYIQDKFPNFETVLLSLEVYVSEFKRTKRMYERK